MSDGGAPPEAGQYRAEELADELTREAATSVDRAREKDDYVSAWRIARDRVAALVQLGVVEADGSTAGMTFEEIVRLADEPSEND